MDITVWGTIIGYLALFSGSITLHKRPAKEVGNEPYIGEPATYLDWVIAHFTNRVRWKKLPQSEEIYAKLKLIEKILQGRIKVRCTPKAYRRWMPPLITNIRIEIDWDVVGELPLALREHIEFLKKDTEEYIRYPEEIEKNIEVAKKIARAIKLINNIKEKYGKEMVYVAFRYLEKVPVNEEGRSRLDAIVDVLESFDKAIGLIINYISGLNVQEAYNRIASAIRGVGVGVGMLAFLNFLNLLK